MRRWLEQLNAPADGAGLGVFRCAFGALMLLSVLRFWAYGWIDEIYLQPDYHFTYFGFGWVKPWPGQGLYVHFAIMALSAASLCVGCFSRASAFTFFVTFTYAELIEKASYLNHYYLVSLLSLLLAVLPCGAEFSCDAWWRRRQGAFPLMVRRWVYALLRIQAGLVYVFAGFAKLNADWLGAAQPLGTWLAQRADAPLIGPWLAAPITAYAASYFGALFDLSIPLWLSWRRARPYAYAVLVAFHVSVWLLFPIGVFSWVMIVTATVFFDASWPRAWLRQKADALDVLDLKRGRLEGVRLTLAAAYVLLQVCLPLRFSLYPGDVNWHEQGFRFSWRVMLVEKAGQVEFTVRCAGDGRRFVVRPRELLTPLQYKMMSTQPDMIQQYAQHLQRSHAALGCLDARVYADAWVSMNGRPRQRLIDPEVDLAGSPDSLRAKPWILPLAEPATAGAGHAPARG